MWGTYWRGYPWPLQLYTKASAGRSPRRKARIMFDMADTRRTSAASIYRANRAAGFTAVYALAMARHITGLLQALQVFTLELIWSERVQALYTWEDTNAGVSLTYELWRDYDVSPEDAECYDAEDIAAWKNDDWHYYGVTVTATLGRFSVQEILGGIDAGDYWESAANPLDTEEQIMSTALEYYPVRDMVTAVQDAAIAACLQVSP